MAHDYLKTVIKSTAMDRKSEVELGESCFEDESPSESNHSIGIRSPGAVPMRGRSVKEFEEQLSNLKKENFNLKLRIYFLEERMGTNFNLDKENIVKKNVELMVELESLKKELHEKHQLLCQAVKAIELEEEERKKISAEKDEVLEACQQEIASLKSQLGELRHEADILTPLSSRSGQPTDLYPSQPLHLQEHSTSVAIKELQEKISSLEEELAQEKSDKIAVQMVLDQKDSSMSKQLEALHEESKQREDTVLELSSRLDDTRTKYLALCKKFQDKSRLADELANENSSLRKREALLSNDLEKEHKRFEKMKVSSEQKIHDLQSRLEMSLSELKKSQELVVSKRSARRAGYTDADSSISVPKPATSFGLSQKDTFLVPPQDPSPLSSPVHHSQSPLLSASSSPNADPKDLRSIIEQLMADCDAKQQKIVKLKAEQMKACKIIKTMIESKNHTKQEMEHLRETNDVLAKKLDSVSSTNKPSVSSTTNPKHPTEDDSENAMLEQREELLDHYKQLTDELEEKNQVLQTALTEQDNHYKRIQTQYEEILENLKQKESHIVDLEFELVSKSISGQINQKRGDLESDRNSLYIKKIQERDNEIERLNRELLKRNFDLQTLINNELWQKNREIEKLQKKQSSQTLVEDGKEHEVVSLRNNLHAKDVQLKIIKERISELGIEIDLQSGDVNVDNNLQVQLERSEKLRLETNEVCAVLSRRLEELAVFLDSLLKQKTILGFLGRKENRKLRQMINQSLDLSRSLNMSILTNPDHSLLQLTNITSILNNTSVLKCEEDEEFEANSSNTTLNQSSSSLTYKSHLYDDSTTTQNHSMKPEESSQIIETLRQQIVTLKYELQLRDVELGKITNVVEYTETSSEKEDKTPLNTTSTTLKYKSDNQSESESWSEPDRSVSRARIGLESSQKKTITSTDSTEDDEDTALNSRSSSRKVLNDSRNTILELHRQMCELEQKVQEKEIAYCETLKVNNQLKRDLQELEDKLRETASWKIEADNRVKVLTEEKQKLLETIDSFSKSDGHLQEKIERIEKEKEEALLVAEEAEEAAEEAKNELKEAASRLQNVQANVVNMEKSLRIEYEKQLLDKSVLIQAETEQRIQEIQKRADLEIQTMEDNIMQMQAEYEENYVKKIVVEEAIQEIEKFKRQIEESEQKINLMSVEERAAKAKLSEYEERVNALMADLNNATLQYSEVVLEKAKMANEKSTLEQELDRALLKEVDQKKNLDRLESELAFLKQSHQKELSALDQEKSHLEVRISELESSNAQLHNRLIKIQSGFGDHMLLSTSLPTPSNFVNEIVSFRRQNSDESGFILEHPYVVNDPHRQPLTIARSSNRILMNQNVNESERHEANSSPDLGIESDHGRFSSLEAQLNNVPRPLLQTLELTESMSNLLDSENNPIEPGSTCPDDHCCLKSQQMANENSDLKRKLLRTRRALEETVTQLTLANQRKKQVEKNICNQIHKTSQVLRKAKANLDSGSETDLCKK